MSECGTEALFGEQVQFRLLGKGHLDQAGPGGADAFGQRQGQRQGLSRAILRHADEGGKALARDEQVAHASADHTRRDQHHIDAGGRLDEAKGDVVTRGKDEGLAPSKMWCDLRAVEVRRNFVGKEEHDDVAPLGGVFNRQRCEPVLASALGVGILAVADDDVQPAVAQVQGLGAALVAIANHGYLAAFQQGQICVRVAVYSHHRSSSGLVGINISWAIASQPAVIGSG